MADSVVTVHDVFDLPHPGSPEESSPRWQTLRQWISEELQGVKTSAFDDIGAKIGELLDIPVTDVFLASWKRTDAIKELLEESRKVPDAITSVELSDHTIKTQHHPHIEVRTRNGPPKRIEFRLRLLFKLKGFSLQIQNGSINELQSGPCEMQGTLEYQGLAVAEKKAASIDLPLTVTLETPARVEGKEATTGKMSSNGSGERFTEKKATPASPKPEVPVKQPGVVPEKPTVMNVSDAATSTPARGELEPELTETARETGASEAPVGVATEPEEEREVFVL